jgi:cellulose synthase/poly-beta-1,6-N-acetylglucosamine synthase-like glycosyltransferase
MVPSLSVIVPFYDEIEYISDALASLDAQGISDVEIILVNDNPERISQEALGKIVSGHAVTLISHP